MLLNTATENWRNSLLDLIGRAEEEVGLDSASTELADYDECADELASATLTALTDAGVEWIQAYQQSVGAFAIIQGGDAAEIEAFNSALESALVGIYPSVLRRAKELA
jgi:hypothetical protein